MTQLLNYSIPRIVVSALRGGSGKTILSLSLLAVWQRRGIKVTPFKKGPDYIDAGWLACAAQKACFNLDLFMLSSEEVVHSFITHADKSDVAIIEGNRGLYDGMDHEGTYSTAELAKLLRSPVLIIVDCNKVTTTVAAMILGCKRFDPDVAIKGVLLNNVANSRQESVIRRAISEKCGIPVLGDIPRLKDNPLPERHMGLTPFYEHREVEEAITRIGDLAERYIDIDSILRIAEESEPIIQNTDAGPRTPDLKPRTSIQNPKSKIHCGFPRIGVIRDSAFQFYYPENLEELQRMGAVIVDVSALREEALPDIDALYIGGGFPETHALKLSENEGFRRSLNDAIEKGLPVYAECGGLMYLGKTLILNDKRYPMVGALPLTFKLEEKAQAHGYTIVEVRGKNPYFSDGTVLKGHEFHYSHVVDASWKDCYFVFKLKRGKGIRDGMDGICYKNVLATYTHLHALGSPEWVQGMIRAALRHSKVKMDA